MAASPAGQPANPPYGSANCDYNPSLEMLASRREWSPRLSSGPALLRVGRLDVDHHAVDPAHRRAEVGPHPPRQFMGRGDRHPGIEGAVAGDGQAAAGPLHLDVVDSRCGGLLPREELEGPFDLFVCGGRGADLGSILAGRLDVGHKRIPPSTRSAISCVCANGLARSTLTVTSAK